MPSRNFKLNAPSKNTRAQSSNFVVLDRVLGFTLVNNSALSLYPDSGLFAYAAGCVVVLRSLIDDQQRFIQSNFKKSITAVEFSPDGRHIATGESGHQPMVRVWTVADGIQQAEFAGHHFRVIAVRFSPSGRYLVSLGSQEDNTLYVWDRISRQRIASAKVTNRVNSVAFSPDGQFFVTVGVRHIRYWYLETKRPRNKETVPLNGRNAVLGDLLNNNFMDVCCLSRQFDDQSSASNTDVQTADVRDGVILTLVVSRAGQLLQFNDQRYLDKWVELRTAKANCLSVHGSTVVVGCTQGTCLLFHSETLQFLVQIPLPHQLGTEAPLLWPISDGTPDSSQFADLLAIRLDCLHSRLVCFYADHSLYVWDIGDLTNVQCASANFYHSRGVWSVDCLSELSRKRLGKTLSGFEENQHPSWWSPSTFVTCADDGTVRFWEMCDEPLSPCAEFSTCCSKTPANAFLSEPSREKLAHIIYTDPTLKYLCVGDRFSFGVGLLGGPSSSTNSGSGDSALPSPSSPTVGSLNESTLSPPNASSKCNGSCVRAVAISQDCRHLAAGDRDGILRVYTLESFKQVTQVTAHDGEILSLNFFRSESVPELSLLCSASRDRLIHIFDPNQEFSLVQTVADHSAAIFAARIIETEDDGEIRLISCGMDKSLLFRVLEPDDAGLTARFSLEHHLVGRCSQLDAAFTPTLGPNVDNKPNLRKRYLAVACQDRRLRIYNVSTGRQVRCYRGSFNEEGCLVRCTVDPTGSIVATSGSDKQLNLLYLLSGESITTVFGHSELVVGIRFLPTLQHLVTVSSDSCIFVWRLAPNLINQFGDRLNQRDPTTPLCSLPHSAGPRSMPFLKLPQTYRSKESSSPGAEDLPFVESSGELPPEHTPIDSDDFDNSMYVSDTNESMSNVPSELVAQCSDSTDTSGTSIKVTASTISNQPSPAFYFSVSALPAWARRKLSRRCSVAMVSTASNQTQPSTCSVPQISSFDTDPAGSGDSLNSSAEPSFCVSSCPIRRADIMSTSEYREPNSCTSRLTVKDSRRVNALGGAVTVSRDSSLGKMAPMSAPSTPSRDVRSLLEHGIRPSISPHAASYTVSVRSTPMRAAPQSQIPVGENSSCLSQELKTADKQSGLPNAIYERTRSAWSVYRDLSTSAPCKSYMKPNTAGLSSLPRENLSHAIGCHRVEATSISFRNTTSGGKNLYPQGSSGVSHVEKVVHPPTTHSGFQRSGSFPHRSESPSFLPVSSRASSENSRIRPLSGTVSATDVNSFECSHAQTFLLSQTCYNSVGVRKAFSTVLLDNDRSDVVKVPSSPKAVEALNSQLDDKPDRQAAYSAEYPVERDGSHYVRRFTGNLSPTSVRSRWRQNCKQPIQQSGALIDVAETVIRRSARPNNLNISALDRSCARAGANESAPVSVSPPVSSPQRIPSTSTLTETDRIYAAREALESLHDSLSLAVQRCADCGANRDGYQKEWNALRSFVSEELQWRFAKLRSILGLEPMCIDPPIAHAFLTEFVERLIPELRLGLRHTEKVPPGSSALDPCSVTTADPTLNSITGNITSVVRSSLNPVDIESSGDESDEVLT